MFELQTFSTDSKFDKCFKHLVVECKFVEKSLFYDWFRTHREPESEDKLVFSQFNLSHKLQLLNGQRNFLLSDVLHCTNMNTDFTDFRQ